MLDKNKKEVYIFCLDRFKQKVKTFDLNRKITLIILDKKVGRKRIKNLNNIGSKSLTTKLVRNL